MILIFSYIIEHSKNLSIIVVIIHCSDTTEPMFVENISVYWPLENTFYTGAVSSIEEYGSSTIFYGRYSACIKFVL